MHHSFKRALMILNTTPENLSKMLGESVNINRLNPHQAIKISLMCGMSPTPAELAPWFDFSIFFDYVEAVQKQNAIMPRIF